MAGVFVNSAGESYEVLGVPPLMLDKIRVTVEFPSVPQYETEIVGGGKQYQDYNETMIETDDERKIWDEYQTKLKAAQRELQEKQLKLFFGKGIKIDETDEQEWLDEQSYFGIEVPTNPIGRRVHYVETHVVRNVDDMQRLIEEIMRETGLRPEVLQQARKMFQSSLQGKASGELSSENGNGGGEEAEGGGGDTPTDSEGVELQPTLP